MNVPFTRKRNLSARKIQFRSRPDAAALNQIFQLASDFFFNFIKIVNDISVFILKGDDRRFIVSRGIEKPNLSGVFPACRAERRFDLKPSFGQV
jgi:hypothetical protein